MKLDWEKNLGNIDRIIRITIGVILLALVMTKNITGGLAFGTVILAMFQFVEAFFAY